MKVVVLYLQVPMNSRKTHVLKSKLGKKYIRRKRQVFSKDQKKILEEAYDARSTNIHCLAHRANLKHKQVTEWFKNRRKKEKMLKLRKQNRKREKLPRKAQCIDASAAFDIIKSFLAGECKLHYPRIAESNDLKTFCGALAKHLYIKEAVISIVENALTQDLITLLLCTGKKSNSLYNTIIWVLLADISQQPIISAIIKDIQSLFKFTALNTDAFQDAHIAIFQQIADTNQVSIKV